MSSSFFFFQTNHKIFIKKKTVQQWRKKLVFVYCACFEQFVQQFGWNLRLRGEVNLFFLLIWVKSTLIYLNLPNIYLNLIICLALSEKQVKYMKL